MPAHSQASITILGVGNILLSDEGIGVRVVERLGDLYEFGENIQLVDGGVLGVRLMGLVSQSDILIVVDAVRSGSPPGTLYRLEDDQIQRRILAKQSMHQLDLPEVLTLCAAIDRVPRHIVVLGMEPLDIDTMDVRLTPVVAARLEDLTAMVLRELDNLGGWYAPKKPRHSLPM